MNSFEVSVTPRYMVSLVLGEDQLALFAFDDLPTVGLCFYARSRIFRVTQVTVTVPPATPTMVECLTEEVPRADA